MNNFGSQILLNQLKAAHSALEQTMEGVTDEVAHFMPPGTANPIAGVYAHLVFSEDLFMHTFLMKTQPLMTTTFKDKTGASEMQPMDWVVAYPKWLKEVKLDIQHFHEYAKAVFAESEAYVASLSDTDLEKEIDMSEFGMGTRKTYDFIANLISGHVYPIMGEISALKGVQGLKGYPF
ncbi:MAG TPA: DinB family protein [Candidatus Saccharimonadales bacterium]|nr:DinB family protein [Candidatus Saccharimonadales bacterium]